MVESMTVIGDVEGKNVILVDDMVDTAGTITKAADLMMSRGALSVRAIASHAVMSDPASERVQNSSMTELIFTDSIPYTKNAIRYISSVSLTCLPILFVGSTRISLSVRSTSCNWEV